jgi:hypothetical protein
MAVSIHNLLLQRIIDQGKGNLIFSTEFFDLGSNETIRKSLSRLTTEKLLVRIAKGIYLFPKHDPELGILYPSTEQIAEAIAKQDRLRIIPTGAEALYKLGLSTQVPMKVVYLTDGVRRIIKVGKRTITFKSTTPKTLAIESKISTLVIQGLRELGKNQIDEKVIKQIKKALYHEDLDLISNNAKLAPVWIATLLFSILKELEHDRMAETNG